MNNQPCSLNQDGLVDEQTKLYESQTNSLASASEQIAQCEVTEGGISIIQDDPNSGGFMDAGADLVSDYHEI